MADDGGLMAARLELLTATVERLAGALAEAQRRLDRVEAQGRETAEQLRTLIDMQIEVRRRTD